MSEQKYENQINKSNGFKIIFDVIGRIIDILISIPFIFLGFLLEWVKIGIVYSVFWLLVYTSYHSFTKGGEYMSPGIVFSNTVIAWLIGLSLASSIFVTVQRIRN